LECEWRVCVSSTDALVGHSWAYGEICVLLTHLLFIYHKMIQEVHIKNKKGKC